MTDAAREPLPTGAPERLEIDGILEGRIRDEAALSAAAAQLDRCGFGAFHCEITGGRFSLLPRETQLSGRGVDEARQTHFLETLGELVGAAIPGSVESTLRCRMVFANQVVETLFAVRGAAVEPVSRARQRLPDDAPGNDAAAPLPFGLRRRELLWLAPVLLVLGVLVAWQGGWIDRVLAARAEGITVDTGPFERMLDVQVQKSWGDYVVVVGRGETFPASPQALTALRDRAASLEARAACEVVGNGDDLWLQLRADDGTVLETGRMQLRELLGGNATVRVRLPGRIRAATIALSLTQKRPEPK